MYRDRGSQIVREREIQRERHPERDTEWHLDRQKQTETDRDRQRQTETDRHRHIYRIHWKHSHVHLQNGVRRFAKYLVYACSLHICITTSPDFTCCP